MRCGKSGRDGLGSHRLQFQWLNLAQAAVEFESSLRKIVGGLEIEPEFWRCSEEAGEAKRGVGGDAAASVENLSHAGWGHLGADGKLIRCDSHGKQEVFAENLAGMGRHPFCGPSSGWSVDRHGRLSVASNSMVQ